MKNKIILLLFSLFIINQELSAKRILTNKRLGLNYSVSNNFINNTINQNSDDFDSSISGINFKYDIYIKKDFTMSPYLSINVLNNGETNDILYDFIPFTFTKHLNQKFNIFAGIGYSFGRIYNQSENGYNTILGAELKLTKRISIGIDSISNKTKNIDLRRTFLTFNILF
jgi:hypothetical protein